VDRKTVGTIQRLENLEAKARTDAVCLDVELQAQIARFLCVLASGVIEQVLIGGLESMVLRNGNRRVADYVSHHLSRINNAKFEDILVALGRFDSSWRVHFETRTDTQTKDAIDSVVNNRNQIAHGGQVNISLVRFSQYYKTIKPFLLYLDSFLNSH
jgi:hypothetical protein